MKSYSFHKQIDGSLYRLFEILPGENWSKYSKRVEYKDAPHQWASFEEEKQKNLYWLPIDNK